jgi:hypothetical protein
LLLVTTLRPYRSSSPAAPAHGHAAGPLGRSARGLALEEILHTPVADPKPGASLHAPVEGLRTARRASVSGRRAAITLRGQHDPVEATIASEVDPAVICEALETGDSVLVELTRGECPLIVGVLHTRQPREIRLKATTIQIEGEEEVLIRSGRGALRRGQRCGTRSRMSLPFGKALEFPLFPHLPTLRSPPRSSNRLP